MSEYKVDRLEIANQREENAAEIVSSALQLEQNTQISFIKQTYDFAKIRDNKTETYQLAVWSILVKIAGLTGIKNQIDDFTKYDLVNMIYKVHSDLSLQEIWKAFELERYGEFDNKTEHHQLFGAEYVSNVLKKYKSWKQKIKTHHNFNPNTQKLPEMSESQKKTEMDNAIIRRFNEYKETKVIDEISSFVFDELIERGLIKKGTFEDPTPFYYFQKKLKQAEEEIKSELELEKYRGEVNKHEFKDELIKIAESQSEKAQIRAKRIILQEFFDKHIKNNTDFESLIKNS